MDHRFATIEWPDYPRRELRAKLVDHAREANSPMPPAAIDEIVDLACHAAALARRAMLEAIDRTIDPRVATTAVGLASSLVRHDCGQLEEALKAYASQSGAKFYSSRVEVQHG